MALHTPLYAEHVRLGGKIVEFAGFDLPVQYGTGVIAEHNAVRRACGLFDVSHMGELVLRGHDALANLQNLLTNDMANLEIGRARYSPMCYETGGTVDDLLMCKTSSEVYLLVVNASNRQKDEAWIRTHLFGDVALTDISDGVAQVALQGPRAKRILSLLTDAADIPVKYYSFIKRGWIGGVECLVSRTGYTGEAGYELYCAPDQAAKLWNRLLEVGAPLGLIPCGLGARDTLRLEAAMPLYGHELSESITPLEAGLNLFVSLDKPDFIGKAALLAAGAPKRTRVGLSVIDRGIAREHCAVYAGNELVGETTSGTHCPYLNRAVAMALMQVEYASVGTRVQIEVRGKRLEAEVVELPFYHRGGK